MDSERCVCGARESLDPAGLTSPQVVLMLFVGEKSSE